MWLLVIATLIQLGCADIQVIPPEIASASIRSAKVPLQVLIYFTGNDTLISDTSSNSHVYIREDVHVASPNGPASYWTTMCPSPCFQLMNSSLGVLSIAPESAFDVATRVDVVVVVDKAVFSDRVSREFFFSFLPDDIAADIPLATISAVSQIFTMTTSFLLPGIIDTAIVPLYAMQPCTMVEQRAWAPMGEDFAFVFGGNTIFERAWRIPVILGGVFFIVLIIANRWREQLEVFIRVFLPLVIFQIILYFSPGLLFASTFLLTYGEAISQTFGVALGLGVAGILSIGFFFLSGDKSLMFTPLSTTGANKALRCLEWGVKGVGAWSTPRYALIFKGSQLLFIHRLVLNFFFSEISKLLMVHFINTFGALFVCGAQLTSAALCAGRGYGVGALLGLGALNLVFIRFRSPAIHGLCVVIRILITVQVGLLTLLPSNSRRDMFFGVSIVTVILQVTRCVIVGVHIYLNGLLSESITLANVPDSICDDDVEMQKFSEQLLPPPAADTSWMRSLDNNNDNNDDPDERDREHAVTPVSVMSKETSDAGIENEVVTHAFVREEISTPLIEKAPPRRSKEPPWLSLASEYPLKQKNERLSNQVPVWFPPERPNVRTTNEGDRALDLSPYVVADHL